MRDLALVRASKSIGGRLSRRPKSKIFGLLVRRDSSLIDGLSHISRPLRPTEGQFGHFCYAKVLQKSLFCDNSSEGLGTSVLASARTEKFNNECKYNFCILALLVPKMPILLRKIERGSRIAKYDRNPLSSHSLGQFKIAFASDF